MNHDYCIGYSMGWGYMNDCGFCPDGKDCMELSLDSPNPIECQFMHLKNKFTAKQCRACRVLCPDQYQRCISRELGGGK